MKTRATVIDVDDPRQVGRIRVKLIGYAAGSDESAWCWPCSPMAGPGYGFYCLPVVGDEVWVEQTAEKDWVWTGFYWSDRKAKPTDGTADVRLIRTPIGHQLKIDEAGDIEIRHSNGSIAVLRQNGDIEVTATKNILLNDNGTTRAVNTMSICNYTGTPHPQGSRTVFTEKP